MVVGAASTNKLERIHMIRFAALILLPTILITACGGGDNNDSDSDGVLTGVFLDSAVSGVAYATETQSGTTNEDGQFQYLEGENVIFSIGSLVFPEVMAAAEVSPVDMSPSATIEDNVTVNIARLLQSLDTDNNPTNGIAISETADASSTQIDFAQSFEDFSNNVDVINFVANSGSSSSVLISPDVASAHLSSTLGVDGFVRVATLETLNERIVDRVLQFTDNRTVIRSDNTIGLIIDDELVIFGTWSWEDSLFCRDIDPGDSGAPAFDCQVFELNGDILRFTGGSGAGNSEIGTITDVDINTFI